MTISQNIHFQQNTKQLYGAKRKSYVTELPNLIEKAGRRHTTKYIFSNNQVFLNGCKLSWMLVEPQIMWPDESYPLKEKKR